MKDKKKKKKKMMRKKKKKTKKENTANMKAQVQLLQPAHLIPPQQKNTQPLRCEFRGALGDFSRSKHWALGVRKPSKAKFAGSMLEDGVEKLCVPPWNWVKYEHDITWPSKFDLASVQ